MIDVSHDGLMAQNMLQAVVSVCVNNICYVITLP